VAVKGRGTRVQSNLEDVHMQHNQINEVVQVSDHSCAMYTVLEDGIRVTVRDMISNKWCRQRTLWITCHHSPDANQLPEYVKASFGAHTLPPQAQGGV